ncbi:MAG: DNA gyrase inhibitor YacG [Chthoniobacter sp.]|uniref:DNA gyrase inhibitor YacG n=1 Tax=Chthoniobacter sp. TaxID=2510640 RepID=UPI0032AC06E5
MPKPTPVHCPICQKENDFFAGPMGTFCSQRCKLVDLGKWLGEEYRVSEPLRPDHLVEFEDVPESDLDRLE